MYGLWNRESGNWGIGYGAWGIGNRVNGDRGLGHG